MQKRFWAVLLIVWGGSTIAFPFGNRRYGIDTYSGTQLLGTFFGAALLIVGVALLVRSFRR